MWFKSVLVFSEVSGISVTIIVIIVIICVFVTVLTFKYLNHLTTLTWPGHCTHLIFWYDCRSGRYQVVGIRHVIYEGHLNCAFLGKAF
jgi:hypothetical protein